VATPVPEPDAAASLQMPGRIDDRQDSEGGMNRRHLPLEGLQTLTGTVSTQLFAMAR
jgi:hypothetical protein